MARNAKDRLIDFSIFALILGWLGIVGLMIWVVIHFVVKFW